MQLDQPSNALPQFEQALQWKKILVDREPDDARHARDWSEIHSDLGTAQIALGRFDEGLTNLDEAVRLAEALAERDPSNGSSQDLLAGVLQDEAKGCATGRWFSGDFARPASRALAAGHRGTHPLPGKAGFLSTGTFTAGGVDATAQRNRERIEQGPRRLCETRC